MERKFIKKIAAIVIALQIFYSANGPALILAQEEGPTPEPTSVPEQIQTIESSPTTSPSVSPEPINTPESALETADSNSSADSETITNVSDVTVSPSPEPEVSPEPTLKTSEESQPPETPLPDEPTAIDETSTLLNEGPADPPVETEKIEVDQTGQSTTNTTSTSNSGGNTQSVDGNATTDTGNATATTNSVTVTNLSQINSNVIKAVETVLSSDDPDINLYEKLLEAITSNPNIIPEGIIEINQEAVAISNTEAASVSGDNTQISDTASISTGDSIAVANSITAANLNLIGSNLIIALINILSDYEGDIILPNDILLQNSNDDGSESPNLSVTQSAITNQSTTALSTTGDNTQIGQNSLVLTGNASSASNSLTLSNIVQLGGSLGYLVINNYGNWTGSLNNWQLPGSLQKFGSGSYTLQQNNNPLTQTASNAQANISVNQRAYVSSNTKAVANSGGNTQVSDNSNLVTGDSLSISNNTVLANLTGVKSGIFFGVINILGNWSGNIISAYPELSVSLTDNLESIKPGETQSFTLSITNKGKAHAHRVGLNFRWPEMVTPTLVSPAHWDLGDLAPGETRIFNLFGRVNDNALGTLLASAEASTNDVQSTTDSNSSTDSTLVNSTAQAPSNPPPDTRTPVIEVTSWNNTGEFVYPGDKVLVKLTVANKSPFPAKDVNLVAGVIEDGEGEVFPMSWNLGNIRPNGKGTISFSLDLTKTTLPALYHIIAKGSGKSDSGDTSYSNLAVSNFTVKNIASIENQGMPIVSEAKIENLPPTTPEVLGLDSETPAGNPINRLYPYIFPILIASYILIQAAKRKLGGQGEVTPGLVGLIKRKRAALAGGLFTLFFLAIVFIKRHSY